MKSILRWLIIYVFVFVGASFAVHSLGIELGVQNFWHYHTVFFLFFITFFPRLTLLFATPWGGVFWWLGLVFTPRLMVAILATLTYWNQNPALVVFSWFIALSGEVGEKAVISRRAIIITPGSSSYRNRPIKDVDSEVR